MYKPQPIDTSEVVLPDNLMLLVEKLSAHCHDSWSLKRKSEGWTYGKQRDDIKKTTPCLVPYDYLSEDEKNIDRTTVLSTLKALIKLGYSISIEPAVLQKHFTAVFRKHPLMKH